MQNTTLETIFKNRLNTIHSTQKYPTYRTYNDTYNILIKYINIKTKLKDIHYDLFNQFYYNMIHVEGYSNRYISRFHYLIRLSLLQHKKHYPKTAKHIDHIISNLIIPKLNDTVPIQLDEFIITPEIFDLFISVINPDKYEIYILFYRFLFWLGLRRSEALALQLKHINLESRTIIIKHNLYFAKSKGYVQSTPKTKTSYRKITYPEILHHSILKLFQDNKSTENFIFRNNKNNILSYTTIARIFKQHLKLCNEIYHLSIPLNLNIHSLRSAHASFMRNNHIPDELGAARLGNTVDIYRKHYAKFDTKADSKVTSLIDMYYENKR